MKPAILKKNNSEIQRVNKILYLLFTKNSNFWTKKAKANSLKIFHFCVNGVSAYRQLLKKYLIRPRDIRNYSDLNRIPVVTKDNYLRKYKWEDLCIKSSLNTDSLVLTSTSGSTGTPFYFPRNSFLDYCSSVYHELFLKTSQIDQQKSTLVIVCFGMGVWIGGIITYEAFKKISERSYPLTVITPGVNKKEIFEALKNIAPKYDQVILCGYPPFIKDLIDEAPVNGVVWKKFDLRIIFAAESFSETFRDYIIKKTSIRDVYRHTMNIYGSADLGTMAFESPLCILIRRLALKNRKLYKKLFSDSTRVPTLAQFNPDFVNFEVSGIDVLCTGLNVLPLFKYRIGDHGGVFTYNDLVARLGEEGVDLDYEVKKAGIRDTITQLPFVYVYERSDLSTKLYGAIIYPEHIKDSLLHPKLEPYLTGKFTLATKYDKKEDEYLEVNIELKPQINPRPFLKELIVENIVNSLLSKSTEYRDQFTHHSNPGRIKPIIIFWPNNHPVYFLGNSKQKWVKIDRG